MAGVVWISRPIGRRRTDSKFRRNGVRCITGEIRALTGLRIVAASVEAN